ncbi:MAG TPA: VOC family protein [Candidatus Binataceae bacterium]|nr:VOC family protein [Candidatus Binataceae bacterium]
MVKRSPKTAHGRDEPREAILRKIDCVMIKVDDLEAAARFYEETLGLAPRWSTTHSVALGMPESEAEIVLHDDPQIPRECGVHYLVDNVKEAVAKLSVQGCEIVVPPFEVQIGLCAVARDPFGNLLNLIDMSKGPIKAA